MAKWLATLVTKILQPGQSESPCDSTRRAMRCATSQARLHTLACLQAGEPRVGTREVGLRRFVPFILFGSAVVLFVSVCVLLFLLGPRCILN